LSAWGKREIPWEKGGEFSSTPFHHLPTNCRPQGGARRGRRKIEKISLGGKEKGERDSDSIDFFPPLLSHRRKNPGRRGRKKLTDKKRKEKVHARPWIYPTTV